MRKRIGKNNVATASMKQEHDNTQNRYPINTVSWGLRAVVNKLTKRFERIEEDSRQFHVGSRAVCIEKTLNRCSRAVQVRPVLH